MIFNREIQNLTFLGSMEGLDHIVKVYHILDSRVQPHGLTPPIIPTYNYCNGINFVEYQPPEF